MDRRDFIKSAAVGGVGMAAATGAAELASAQGIDYTPVASTEGQGRVAELLKAFNFKDYVKFLEQLTSGNTAALDSGQEFALELQPIDKGAAATLAGAPEWRIMNNPYEVEYLLTTADDHIRTCLQLREQSQQIELLWLATKSQILMEGITQKMHRDMAVLAQSHDPMILGSMYAPSISGSTVVGSTADSAKGYFSSVKAVADSHIDASALVTRGKIAAATQPGGAF